MRSGYADCSGIWGNPYYEEQVPADLHASTFTRRTFAPGPALIVIEGTPGEMAGTTEKFCGQAYDPATRRLEPEAWDHEHCDVCNFCIDPGFEYWESGDGCITFCDACYEHYVLKSR